jgi:hypothetical protein
METSNHSYFPFPLFIQLGIQLWADSIHGMTFTAGADLATFWD